MVHELETAKVMVRRTGHATQRADAIRSALRPAILQADRSQEAGLTAHRGVCSALRRATRRNQLVLKYLCVMCELDICTPAAITYLRSTRRPD